MKLTLAAGNGFRQHLMYKLDTRCTYCKILPLTGVLSQLRVMLHDWAARPVRDDCYSWAAVSLIDSKTLWQRNFSLGRRQVLQSLGVIVGLSLKNCTPILSTMPKYKLLDCLLAHAKCLCASQCRKAGFSKLSPPLTLILCARKEVSVLGLPPPWFSTIAQSADSPLAPAKKIAEQMKRIAISPFSVSVSIGRNESDGLIDS